MAQPPGKSDMTDDRLVRFDATGAPVRTRRYAPQCDDLCDMAGAARELGISRRSLERLLADPDWPGPRPFRLGTRGRKALFRKPDLKAYLAAAALLSRMKPSNP